VSDTALLSFLSDLGVDQSRESTRLYVEQFMREPVAPAAPVLRCSATSAPDYECMGAHDHRGPHCWRRNGRPS
jgi:hypothetical protein